MSTVMKRIFVCLAFAAGPWLMGVVHAGDEFLDPEVAFKLSSRALDGQRIEIRFDIAPGYYLYGDKFTVDTSPPGAKPSASSGEPRMES